LPGGGRTRYHERTARAHSTCDADAASTEGWSIWRGARGTPELAILAVLALTAALLVGVPSLATPTAADEHEGTVATARLSGARRIDTAVAISEYAYPNGAAEVFLARADVFADALTAGTITSGPVLLVHRCGPIPESVRAEVARLDPDVVYALGGENAVCDDVLRGIAGSRDTGRLAGQSRFDTAVAISQFEFADGAEVVYLARAIDVESARTFFLKQSPERGVGFTCPAISPGKDFYAVRSTDDPAVALDTRDESERQVSEAGTVVAINRAGAQVLVTGNGLFNIAEDGSAEEIDLSIPGSRYSWVCPVGETDQVLVGSAVGVQLLLYDLSTGARVEIPVTDDGHVGRPGYCAAHPDGGWMVAGRNYVDFQAGTARELPSLGSHALDVPGHATRTPITTIDAP
jgi:hypothetical protein